MRRALNLLGWLLLGCALVVPWRNTFIDDAWISLLYARTLASCGEFGPRCGASYYGFTSVTNQLWLGLVGAGTQLVARFEDTLLVSSILQVALLGLAAQRLATKLFRSALPAVALVLLVAGSPLLVSTHGMESLLAVVVLLLLLDALLDRASARVGLLSGLLALTRPEMAVIPPLLWLLYRRELRLGRALLVAVAVALPWHLFAWLILGSAVPMPFFLKVGVTQWWLPFYRGFALYLRRFPAMWLASAAPPLLALCVPLCRDPVRRKLAFAAALAGLAHLATYALLNVQPFHWYYAPGFAALTIGGWIAALDWLERRRQPMARAAAALTAAGALVTAAGLLAAHGDFDEAPIHTNWARPALYREIGLWIDRNLPADARLDMEGEVGDVAFFARRDFADALVDPDWPRTHLAEVAARPRHSLRDRLTMLNFAFYLKPEIAEAHFKLLMSDQRPMPTGDIQILSEWSTYARWREGQVYFTVLFKP